MQPPAHRRLLLPLVAVVIVGLGITTTWNLASADQGGVVKATPNKKPPAASFPTLYERTTAPGPVAVPENGDLSHTATCDPGDQIVSGGFTWSATFGTRTDISVAVRENRALLADNAWRATIFNTAGA